MRLQNCCFTLRPKGGRKAGSVPMEQVDVVLLVKKNPPLYPHKSPEVEAWLIFIRTIFCF